MINCGSELTEFTDWTIKNEDLSISESSWNPLTKFISESRPFNENKDEIN
jgi:hypothetical protein